MIPNHRVAIVGAGPSGFYTAEALLDRALPIEVDVIDALPAPFGLVRYGVAPDHQKLKAITTTFAQIASKPGFRFLGNVCVGRDVSLAELRSMYDAVVLTCGASATNTLDVPGERLPGVSSAHDFVGWYNGHPSYRNKNFDLSCDSVVIVGHGNVALDICRILAKSPDELRGSDIAQHALDALGGSRISDIHLVGRREPALAKFTRKELRQLGELAETSPCVNASDFCCESDEAPAAGLAKLFANWSQRSKTAAKRIHFHFRARPVAFKGRGRVTSVVFERGGCTCPAPIESKSPAGAFSLPAGLAFTAVGYRGVPLAGAPFDAARGIVPNEAGRVVGRNGRPIDGLYVAGWFKRGANGVIGTNRPCGSETAGSAISDLPTIPRGKPGHAALVELLGRRAIRIVSFEDWSCIDAAERRAGRPSGKPREKLDTVADMLAVLDRIGDEQSEITHHREEIRL